MSEVIELLRPDDWHVHLRDGAALRFTVPPTARVFQRAVVMPNLSEPVTTVAAALAYRQRILAAVPDAARGFEPLMTLYLTGDTTPAEIRAAAAEPAVVACKLYPAGATTNSAAGVSNLEALNPVFEAMQATDLPLLVHGESIDPSVDVFDREAVFIERSLAPLCERFEGLRVVFEHITTAEAADFVLGARAGLAATLTPQHLLMNRNDLFQGGLRPHHYCLPVLKRDTHQAALARAVLSGSPRFFLGTDSAPHARGAKQSDCGCAGCFSAPAALELYAEFFARHAALERLEPFASHHGADFYGLPRNTAQVVLEPETWRVPSSLPFSTEAGAGAADAHPELADTIVPYWADRELRWRLR